MDICEKSKCTACYACFNACKKNAITFKEGKYGALYPVIDSEKCVNCNACRNVCPNNNERTFNIPLKCFAAYTTDDNKRRMSASGGIGNGFAEFCIDKGGFFYGAVYKDDFEVVFKETQNFDELENFKGSKYVHSHINDTFAEIKQRLIEEKKVVFIALPCQIAGLNSFLKRNYDNLITVDLICHGVCPSLYLKNEISYIEKRKRAKVKTCIFRNNAGLNFCFVLVNSNKTIVYKRGAYFNPYFRGFLTAVTLRENCYTCDYARKERISDITIGDFICLGKDATFSGNKDNASVVIVNTKKGLNFYNNFLSEHKDFVSVERDYSEAVKYGPSLNAPFQKHSLTDLFREQYERYGFAVAARKTLRFEIFKECIKKLCYMAFHFYRIYKLPSKILKRIKKWVA